MSDITWLDPDEIRVWKAYYTMSQLLLSQLSVDLQKDRGIALSAYGILARLSMAPDRTLRMSELADYELSSRSRISHAVSRLEDLGWVERTECATDKRGSFARLTDAGYEKLRTAAPTHVQGVRSYFFDQLNDEQLEQLYEIADAVTRNLRSLDQPDCAD